MKIKWLLLVHSKYVRFRRFYMELFQTSRKNDTNFIENGLVSVETSFFWQSILKYLFDGDQEILYCLNQHHSEDTIIEFRSGKIQIFKKNRNVFVVIMVQSHYHVNYDFNILYFGPFNKRTNIRKWKFKKLANFLKNFEIFSQNFFENVLLLIVSFQ